MAQTNPTPSRSISLIATALLALGGSLALSACSFDDLKGNKHESATATTPTAAPSAPSPTAPTTPRAAANNPPVLSGTPLTTTQAGQIWVFTPAASDPEGQPLTFTIANKPGWLSFNASTGGLTGTPAGTDVQAWANVTITASDGELSSTLTPFTLTVTAAPPPPQPTVASATLRWVPPATNTDNSALTDLAGFRVYYGRAAAALDQIVRITNPTTSQQVVSNLTSGTWYFAVSAVSSAGSESALSALASKTFP